jgi:pSer/pThr/pTyr-binding forkhead associated (FHA) protein
VLSIRDLHRIAGSMTPEDFEKQLGPFVLVQRPLDEMTQQRAIQLGTKRTISLSRSTPRDPMGLLLELDDLLVTTLPPLESHERLRVGRLPDCDVVIDDPSVSKHHATLSWDEAALQAQVTDEGSSNGTEVNGVEVKATRAMNDGDEIAFGDARFLFLRTRSLHGRLASARKAR